MYLKRRKNDNFGFIDDRIPFPSQIKKFSLQELQFDRSVYIQ